MLTSPIEAEPLAVAGTELETSAVISLLAVAFVLGLVRAWRSRRRRAPARPAASLERSYR